MATISGAIFDCDGTLLDSMPMWRTAFSDLVGRHGVEATDEMQRHVEPLTLQQSCGWLHEELGLGESGDALYRELTDWVREQYATTVAEMPGARGFLESLAAAGIPMIIATSTPSELVRGALEVHGLDGYFGDIVSTAEVRRGLDKEFPDVYLEALERLAVPLPEVWVFEDAPFGVRTARRAGFHVAAIYNDHDGRDESFVHAWADLFSHEYDTLTLDAIRAFDDAARVAPPEE